MKMKRWISMFCILTLLLPIFNIGVHAEEAVNETIYESEETEMKTENMSKQVYYKNPIYENLDFDLTFEENTSDVKRDVLSPVYLTDEAVVIAEIRNAMRIREKTYVVYFESDNVLDDTFLD